MQKYVIDSSVFNKLYLDEVDRDEQVHKYLPLPTFVKVTNLENRRSIILRVNDRGPFVEGRIIDLSAGAARKLGFYDKGTAKVRVETFLGEG